MYYQDVITLMAYDDSTYRQGGVEKKICELASYNVVKRCSGAKDLDGETTKSSPTICGICVV
jgi:hypothetical protein